MKTLLSITVPLCALLFIACGGPKAVTCESFMGKFQEMAVTDFKNPTPEQIAAVKKVFKSKLAKCKIEDLKNDPEGVKCVLAAKKGSDLLAPACRKLSEKIGKW